MYSRHEHSIVKQLCSNEKYSVVLILKKGVKKICRLKGAIKKNKSLKYRRKRHREAPKNEGKDTVDAHGECVVIKHEEE